MGDDRELARLREENARLRKALRPFADYAESRTRAEKEQRLSSLPDDWDLTGNGGTATVPIKMGDCRRAAEALKA